LSRKLPALLATDFPGCEQAFTAGMATSDDMIVWNHALANSLTIVTKDTDFVALSSSLGHPPKVIWLRIGNCPTQVIVNLFKTRFVEIQAFLADPTTPLLALA
jgi:predicted nuclease of predicted toxin-antitoxin system